MEPASPTPYTRSASIHRLLLQDAPTTPHTDREEVLILKFIYGLLVQFYTEVKLFENQTFNSF